MKSRSRRFLVATLAIALGSSLLGLTSMAPVFTSEAAAPQVLTVAAAPMSGTSWQGMLMAGRW